MAKASKNARAVDELRDGNGMGFNSNNCLARLSGARTNKACPDLAPSISYWAAMKSLAFSTLLLLAATTTVAQETTPAEIVVQQRQWVTDIAHAVSQRWLRPPGLSEPRAAKLRIEINRDGSFKAVSIVKPSGDARYDESALNAVLKAEPLPVPSNDAAFVEVLLPTFDSRTLEEGAAQQSIQPDGPASGGPAG